MESASQSYQFSADIDRLFDIIVNNFYSKKEVFLRELVSNASDALEKVRMKMLTNDQVSEKDNLKIEVRANADDLILSINCMFWRPSLYVHIVVRSLSNIALCSAR